jgi:hypothetical protein
MTKSLNYLVLPRRMTDFEVSYLRRMNRIGLVFFVIHLPVFCAVAYFNDTGPGLAALLTIAVLVGPVAAYLTLQNPRAVSVVYGFTSMLMGGLLVHFGQGPVQIEMHFYFFALLAMLAVYANPLVIIVAAVTVALHHLGLWIYLPKSVFNYAAPIWVVAVHAAFAVLESIATCFIARSFFDNVIGLEKIVQARTAELDERNRDTSTTAWKRPRSGPKPASQRKACCVWQRGSSAISSSSRSRTMDAVSIGKRWRKRRAKRVCRTPARPSSPRRCSRTASPPPRRSMNTPDGASVWGPCARHATRAAVRSRSRASREKARESSFASRAAKWLPR